MSGWHYVKGTEATAATLDELKAMLTKGDLTPESLVNGPHHSEWVKAKDVPDFQSVLGEDGKWHYVNAQHQAQEISYEDLKAGLDSGKLKPSTMVNGPEDLSWVAASTKPELVGQDKQDLSEAWHLVDSANQAKPISLGGIFEGLKNGEINPSTMVCSPAGDGWKKVADQPQLKGAADLVSKASAALGGLGDPSAAASALNKAAAARGLNTEEAWHFVNSKNEAKPISLGGLLDGLKNGDLKPDTMVCSPNCDGWKKMADAPELKGVSDLLSKIPGASAFGDPSALASQASSFLGGKADPAALANKASSLFGGKVDPSSLANQASARGLNLEEPWHFVNSSNEAKPISLGGIMDGLQKGELKPDTMVCSPKAAGWTSVADAPELKGVTDLLGKLGLGDPSALADKAKAALGGDPSALADQAKAALGGDQSALLDQAKSALGDPSALANKASSAFGGGSLGDLTGKASSMFGDAMKTRDLDMGAIKAIAEGDPSSLPFDQQAALAIPGVVRMVSGCHDTQTSADVSNVASFELPEDAGPGGAGGACTCAMLGSLNAAGAVDASSETSLTWAQLLDSMRGILKTKGYTQIPQLSSSRMLDIQDPFSLLNPEKSEESKCRALLIGINYIGQKGQLSGCHNDVACMKEYIRKHGFEEGAEMRVLMDDGVNENPTGATILEAFQWLTADLSPGDSLFIHYSGHGGYTTDNNGDEADGKDETLVPVDFMQNGQIVDDLIFKELIMPVPAGVQMTCVMDCCHSGSIMDLPYSLDASEQLEGSNTQMAENPQFNFKKLFEIVKKLWELHQGGASMQDLAKTAGTELAPMMGGKLPGGLGDLAGKIPGNPFGGGGASGGGSGGLPALPF